MPQTIVHFFTASTAMEIHHHFDNIRFEQTIRKFEKHNRDTDPICQSQTISMSTQDKIMKAPKKLRWYKNLFP